MRLVRPEVVAATQVVLPTQAVAERFSRAARSLLARQAAAERESRTLAEIRDALLPKLLSGQIRVKEAERVVAEVV